jgi:hypothetical protein
LTGQNLIRGSELRAVVSEAERFKTAMMAFRGKYLALPGDMTYATDFWGSLGGGGVGAACHGVEATSTETCNGDGNSLMYELDTSTGGGVNERGERFRFWQHLANAGMIEGSYTGRTDSTSNSYVPTRDKNVPASRFANDIWGVEGAPAFAGNADNFRGQQR